jgi:hypothetical protein
VLLGEALCDGDELGVADECDAEGAAAGCDPLV